MQLQSMRCQSCRGSASSLSRVMGKGWDWRSPAGMGQPLGWVAPATRLPWPCQQ